MVTRLSDDFDVQILRHQKIKHLKYLHHFRSNTLVLPLLGCWLNIKPIEIMTHTKSGVIE